MIMGAGYVICAVLGACFGGAIGTSVAVWFMWPRVLTHQKVSFIDQPHDGYTDLMLTIITIMLASVGIMIAVGTLVLGIFSWKGTKLAMSQITRSVEQKAIDNISNEIIRKNISNEVVKESTKQVLANFDIRKTTKEVAETAIEKLIKKFISGDFDEVIEEVVIRVSHGSTVEEEDENFGSQDINSKSACDDENSDSESVDNESRESKPTSTGD